MNYYFELWNYDQENSPFDIQESIFNSQSLHNPEFNSPLFDTDFHDDDGPIVLSEKNQTALERTFAQQPNRPKIINQFESARQISVLGQTKKTVKNRKKRIIKPSPYHNYQKHLNSTMKQLLKLPLFSQASPLHCQLAHELWNVFTESTLSTKKILHFVFNEFNEHLITDRELRDMGFMEIYQRSSRQDLARAKNYLTELALNQLNDQNIDAYLTARRIKNPIKFKKYLLLFRQELEDRFIKKRFTNRSRKQLIKKKLTKL